MLTFNIENTHTYITTDNNDWSGLEIIINSLSYRVKDSHFADICKKIWCGRQIGNNRQCRKKLSLIRDSNKRIVKRSCKYHGVIPPEEAIALWDGKNCLYNKKNNSFPTGLISRVLETLKEYNITRRAVGLPIISYKIKDQRVKPILGKPYELNKVKLRPYQSRVIEAMEKAGRGQIVLCTRGGKSVITAGWIAKYNVPTLIVVPRLTLLEQLKDDLEAWLGISIGVVGDGQKNPQRITLATYQSIASAYKIRKPRKPKKNAKISKKPKKISKKKIQDDLENQLVRDVVANVETTIIDECLPARTQIQTEKGERDISAIVNNKIPENVWSFNVNTKQFEFQPIYDWRKIEKRNAELITIYTKGYTEFTPNHKIYIYENNDIIKKRADEVVVGDKFVGCGVPCLNSLQKQVAIGCVLGDAHIHKISNTTARIQFMQGEKQIEYLNWKKEIFSNVVQQKKGLIKNKSGYNPKKSIFYFNTRGNEDFKDMYRKFYTPRKQPYSGLEHDITDISFAFWIMDDGCLHHNDNIKKSYYYSLSTHGFDKEGNVMLVDILKRKFGVTGKIFFDKRCEKYFIKFKFCDTHIISRLIRCYVHPSMSYKILPEDREYFNFPENNKNNFGYHAVTKINIKKYKKIFVYNISVKNNHNYVVGGKKLVANCQFTPAESLQNIQKNSQKAYYRFGLSGTLSFEEDGDIGRELLCQAYTGKKLIDIRPSELIKDSWLSRPTIYINPIEYSDELKLFAEDIGDIKDEESESYIDFYTKAIVDNTNRNMIICNDTLECVQKGESVLVAVQRKEHGTNLLNILQPILGDKVRYVNGDEKADYLKQTLKDLSEKKIICCIATSVFGIGITVNSLDVLINAKATKARTDVVQLIGRALGITETKKTCKIIDYYDKIKLLEKSSKQRIALYSEEEEYKIIYQ